jgi:hypothetical protein
MTGVATGQHGVQSLSLTYSHPSPVLVPMAHPLRMQYENACYHVTCRGNGQQDIFPNSADTQA